MINALATSVAWLSLSRCLIQAYFLTATIYIARLLSPSDYALMGIAMIIIGLFDLITEFGLGDALVQQKTVSENEKNSAFWFISIFGLSAAAICCFFSFHAEMFFEKDNVSKIIKTLSIVLVLRSVSILPYKMIEKKMRFKLKAMIDLVSKTLSISSACIFAYIGFGVWSLVYSQIIHSACIAILSFVYEPFKPRFYMQLKEIDKMISFGCKIIGLRFTWYAKGSIDKVIAGKLLNSTDFGYYSFGFKLTHQIQSIVLNVMNVVSFPLISKIQDDDIKVNETYLQIVKYGAVFSIPIFMGGILIGDDIIKALFTEKWYPVIFIFKVACFVQMLVVLNSFNEILFNAVGSPQISLSVNIISMFLFAALFYAGSGFGIDGYLYAWIIGSLVLFSGWTYLTLRLRRIKASAYFASLKPALIGTLVMMVIVLFLKIAVINKLEHILQTGSFICLFIVTFSAAFIYIVTLYVFDKTIFISMFSRGSDDEVKTIST